MFHQKIEDSLIYEGVEIVPQQNQTKIICKLYMDNISVALDNLNLKIKDKSYVPLRLEKRWQTIIP